MTQYIYTYLPKSSLHLLYKSCHTKSYVSIHLMCFKGTSVSPPVELPKPVIEVWSIFTSYPVRPIVVVGTCFFCYQRLDSGLTYKFPFKRLNVYD